MSTNVANFRYTAETVEGERVKGTIEASSALVARNQLSTKGLRVTHIAERKGLQVEITKERVPLLEIMHFSRQMGQFMRAGVPVLEGIDNLRQDAKSKRFAAVLGDILERVGAGATVAEAVMMHADVFPPYYMAMLRSSEFTGRMDEAFDTLYRYIKRDLGLQRQVRKALMYPAILLVVAFGVTALIVIFVIPKFASFFKEFDAQLPLPTRMLISVADFVQSPWGLITGLALAGAVIGTMVYIRTDGGRRNFDSLLLKVPVLSKVTSYAATERFSRVLGALLDSGVSLPDALPSAIDCTNNRIFVERLEAASEGLLAGQGFADPLAQTELFPNTMLQMVRVGERTGELSEQLNNSATFFEEELDYSVEKMTQLFEPMVLLFIGVVVGFVALAMVSAMYGIYGQVQAS